MKKVYMTPSVEVVKFNYNDQVVVASGDGCKTIWNNESDIGVNDCVRNGPIAVGRTNP